MKKILALAIIFMLLIPSLALATETTAPADGGVTEEATVSTEKDGEKPAEEGHYSFTIFGYTIIVVPANPEVEGDITTIGIFKTGEDEESEKEIATYSVGGIFGKTVSTVAKAVDPGPEHGKIVSAFVKKCVEERRAEHKAQMEQKKEGVKTRVQEKKEEKMQEIQEKKEEVKERVMERIENRVKNGNDGENEEGGDDSENGQGNQAQYENHGFEKASENTIKRVKSK